jgi:hypothetical protein
VLGRANFRIAAAEVDEDVAGVRRRFGDTPQQRCEVLLRKSLEPARSRAHRPIVTHSDGVARRKAGHP